MADGESSNVTSGVTEGLRDRSLSRKKKQFPWNNLPQELQVKILKNLRRSDLDRCRLLNRGTMELIRCNERCMKRRLINHLVIHALLSSVKCEEEGVEKELVRKFNMTPRPRASDTFGFDHLSALLPLSIYNCLQRILKNANVHHLQLTMLPLTDNILSTIASCLVDAGCRVHTLTVSDTSMDAVTSFMLLRFLRDVDPAEIDFHRIHRFSEHHFSSEIIHFVVTRQRTSF